ncbi:hypothetical protein [Enterococcus durans]|uniref:hypothetical protein n=1 Tax=Enterococcus durans TaxID=53345 RepID=UPI0035D5EEFB
MNDKIFNPDKSFFFLSYISSSPQLFSSKNYFSFLFCYRLMYTNTTLLILGLTCVFFLYYSFKKRGFQFSWGFILAMVFIALTPYIWYNVLANHSQIHFWFTYRVQILTTFALLSIFAFLIPANPLQETTYSNENK